MLMQGKRTVQTAIRIIYENKLYELESHKCRISQKWRTLEGKVNKKGG